jgi:hypothetical protein
MHLSSLEQYMHSFLFEGPSIVQAGERRTSCTLESFSPASLQATKCSLQVYVFIPRQGNIAWTGEKRSSVESFISA